VVNGAAIFDLLITQFHAFRSSSGDRKLELATVQAAQSNPTHRGSGIAPVAQAIFSFEDAMASR